MASSGKSKRMKGKTLALNSFLGDENTPLGFAVVNAKKLDWAEAVEGDSGDERYPLNYKRDEKIVLPTAPKAARGPDIDPSQLPTQPPYTVYLGNLPYDINEDDIMHFFRNLKVTSVRLPREGGDRGRIRGFGYAEFSNREALIEALALNNENLKNRSIRVSLAAEHGGDNDRERRDDRVDRTAGDWRAAPRNDPSGDDRYRNSSYSKDYERGDYGFDNRELYRGRGSYDRDRDGGSRKDQYSSDRDYDKDRRYDRSSRDKPGDRWDSYERGYDRGGRGGRRDFGSGFRDSYDRRRDDYGSRDGFEKRRDDYGSRDGYDRRREDYGSRDSYNRQRDDYGSRDGYDRHRDDLDRKDDRDEREVPRERPKLNLKPRTKPLENMDSKVSGTSASIFGGAKPVDTATKEREIEERLAREKEIQENQRGRLRKDEPRISRSSRSSSRQEDERENYQSRESQEVRRGEHQKHTETHHGDTDSKTCRDRRQPKDDNIGRPPRPPVKYEASSPIYPIANKFSQLMNEEDVDDQGSASD